MKLTPAVRSLIVADPSGPFRHPTSLQKITMQFIFIALLIAFVAQVFAGTYGGNGTMELGSTCGGNCPGGCESCKCGTTSNYQNVHDWCAKWSGWSQVSLHLFFPAVSADSDRSPVPSVQLRVHHEARVRR